LSPIRNYSVTFEQPFMASRAFSILMADDDIEDLELMEEAIRELHPDSRFHKVHNGMAALRYLQTRNDDDLPCLVILDYNMPEMNGAEVLSELSKEPRFKHLSKIILSTSSAPAHIKECKDKGAAEYFVKPTNMKDLNRIVQKLVAYCLA